MNSAMSRWIGYVEEKKGLVRAADKVLLRWQHMCLAPAFVAWEERITQQARARRICQRAIRGWMRQLAASAFQSWYTRAMRQMQITGVCSRIILKLANRCLDAAIWAWKTWMKCWIRCQKILLRLTKHALRDAWSMWTCEARRLSHRQTRIELQCLYVYSTLGSRRTARIFHSWHSHSRVSLYLQNRRMLLLIKRLWGMWRLVVLGRWIKRAGLSRAHKMRVRATKILLVRLSHAFLSVQALISPSGKRRKGERGGTCACNRHVHSIV